MMLTSFGQKVSVVCFWIVIAAIILTPLEYLAIIDIPDSTDYFLQHVDSAVSGPDGRNYIYVGDDLHVVAFNWRHLGRGSCSIWVERNRENVGGKYDGKRTIMQALEQQFPLDGVIRRTSWPIVPERITITKEWFDDPTVDEQEMDIFTSGWYECDMLDKIRLMLGFPRMHHNAKGLPERERTRVVLKRYK